MEDNKNNPDYPDVTCEYGFYPYCPLCPHGAEIHEEWMRDDECEWVCYFDVEKENE